METKKDAPPESKPEPMIARISLEELLQKHESLTAAVSTKDQELNETAARLEVARARFQVQQQVHFFSNHPHEGARGV